MDSAKFVGSIPENYERGLGPHIFDGFAADIAERVAAFNPRKVLELAAGTGIVTRKLRDTLPPACELTASDLNEPMLEVAQAKFAPSERVVFASADAMHLPYADDTFDVLVCQFGVMFFPDKLRAYQEAHRVAERDGRYLFSVWGSWDANPFARLVHETIAGFFPDNPPGFYRVPFGYHDADAIRESVLSAGFSTVSVEVVELISKISADVFSTGLVFGNPLYQEVMDRGADAEELRSAVSAALQRNLGSEMPLQALVFTAQV